MRTTCLMLQNASILAKLAVKVLKMQWRFAGVLCAAVAFIHSLNTLDCGFCYDDTVAVVGNADLHPSSPWTSLLWNDFWGEPLHLNTSHKSYRPLCVATFRLNYMLHGLQPMGYHLVNVVLHAVVCYLYVQLCALVLKQVWVSLLAGLLFAVHPIHTEAVAGVVGRADLLAALFYLLSLIFYHHHVTSSCDHVTGQCSPTTSRVTDTSSSDPTATPKGEGGVLKLLLCIGCAACSLFSKELGVMAIPVCLTYDWFYLQRSCKIAVRGFRKRCVLLLACEGVLILLRVQIMGTPPRYSTTDNEALALMFPYRELHWAYLVSVNAWLLFHPSKLIHDYRMNAISLLTSLWDLRHLATLLTVLPLAMLSIKTLRSKAATSEATVSAAKTSAASISTKKNMDMHKPRDFHPSMDYKPASGEVLSVCLVLMLVPFLPASNLLFPVGFVVAERILYIPSMGFTLLVAYSASRLISSQHRLVSGIAKVGVVILLATHSAKTLSRHRDWYSQLNLYSSLLRQYPSNSHMLLNLAGELRKMEDYGRAEAAYMHAMALTPTLPAAYVNFGGMLKNLERYHQSELILRQAIPLLEKVEPRDHKTLSSIYTTLCNMVAMNSSRLEEATLYCQKAVEVSERSFVAQHSLGAVLLHRGRTRPAIQAFKKAAALNRTSTIAEFNLALAYLSAGEHNMAARTLESVLATDHTHTAARDQLQELKSRLQFS